MPRILHVLASPHLGGAEWMALYLAQEQRNRGHDVRLHFFENGAASTQAKSMGLETTVQNVTTYSRSARWEGYANGLKRAVQTRPPDIAHSHVPLSHLICHRVLPASRIPWVATIHGSWRQFGYAPQTVRKPYLKPYLLLRHAMGDRLATRSAARLVAVSQSTAEDLHRVGISRRRITTVLNGLPRNPDILSRSEGRSRLQLPPDATIIGALGYFAPVKGFDLLVRAFARIAPAHPEALLVIAGGDILGDSAYRESVKRLISTLGVTDQVRLHGTVDPRAGFMAALHIFTMPSLTEGLPLSLIEAMQHGLPSIVSSAGGSLEAARPGQEALDFPSSDVGALASRLETLISDPALRDSLGRSARSRAESYLTIERCAADYEHIYDQVLHGQSL